MDARILARAYGGAMGAAGESTTPPAAASSKATKPSTPTTPATTTTASSAPTPASGSASAPVLPQEASSQQQQQQQAVAVAAVAGAPGYNEWAAAFQAYYQAGAQPPAGFPHPYMWAGQPMMPPYGGPHPTYGAMYPPGAMYAHPMYGQYAGTPTAQQGGGEPMVMGGEQTETKPETKPSGNLEAAGKQTPLKRSRGSRGSLQLLKVSDSGGKRNGVSHSSNGDENENENETGSDGSTEGSRDENEQNLLPKRRFELMAIEAGAGTGGGGGAYMAPPVGGVVPGTPASGLQGGGGGSLDMSLDYWSAGSVPAAKAAKQHSGSPTTTAPQTELWLQDERELKRQRRKQANRESARRSRLRKQAECEELETRVDTLTVENVTLRAELTRVTEECKRLQVENGSLMHQLRNNPQPGSGVQAVGTPAQAAPAAAAAAAPPKEIIDTDKEMVDASNDGNGNFPLKEDKPSGKYESRDVGPLYAGVYDVFLDFLYFGLFTEL